MVNLFRLCLPKSEIEQRLKEFGEESEVFFVTDRDDANLVYVPVVSAQAFQQCFPEAKKVGRKKDVPIFWTFGSHLARGSQRIVEHVSANTLAMHAKAAVAVGHNCEGELATRYGYGVTEKLAGFYVEISQKNYLFTMIGPDFETRNFVKSLYENDPNLLAFLKRVR
jgi:hypothetical protein